MNDILVLGNALMGYAVALAFAVVIFIIAGVSSRR